jgi:hypothetical protein
MPQSKADQAVSTSGTKKKIEELIEQKAVLKQELENLSTISKEEVNKLSLETSQRKRLLVDDLDRVNSLLSAIHKELQNSKNQSVDTVNKLLQEIRTTNRNISDYVFIALAASIVGILTTVALGVPFVFLGVFLSIIGASFAARFTLKYLESKFSSFEFFFEDLKNSLIKIKKLEEDPIPVHVNFQLINDKAASVVSNSDNLREKTAKYVNCTGAYYSLRDKQERLRLFTTKIRNSLVSIGISPNDQGYLDTFSSEYDSEEEWLVEVAEGLSEPCHTNSAVLGLLFAEYYLPKKVNELWSKVASKEKLVRQLAELLYTKYSCSNSPVIVAGEIASVKILNNMSTFSLPIFEKKFNDFYEPFSQSKTNLISAIRSYGVNDKILEKDTLQLVASSNEQQEFLSQLFDLVSVKLSIPRDIFALMYYDNIRVIEEVKTIWVAIKNPEKTELLHKLVSFLIDYKVLDLPTAYSQDQLTTFIIRRLCFLKDYSLLEVKTTIANTFFEMENNKSLVLRAVEHYLTSLEVQTSHEICSYLPQDYPTLIPIIEEVAEKTGIEKEIVELFYNCYIKKRVNGESPFTTFRNSSKLVDLAKLLVDSKRIEIFGEEIEAEQSLITILGSQKDLDLPEIQFLVNKHSMLMTYNRQLANFLHDERLSATGALSFEVLFKTMSKVVNEETYKQLEKLMAHFVRANETTYKQYTSDQLYQLVLATLALFTWRIKDVTSDQAVKKAAEHPIAYRIIYHYESVNEVRIGENKVPLGEIFSNFVEGKYVDDELLAVFRHNLSNGIIISRKQELIDQSIQGVKQQLLKMEEVREILIECQDDFRTVLRTELSKDSITTLLNSSSIIAYIITTNNRSPVMTGVIDGIAEGTIKVNIDGFAEYSSSDDIILLSKDKVVGGYYTRVGIVPLGMSFKEFSDRFEAMLFKAKAEYIKGHSGDADKDYSVRLTRVIPSELASKRIIDPNGELKHPDLYEAIKELMLENFLLDSVEFAISFSGEEVGVKVKEMWTAAIDSSASIYKMIKSELAPITKKYEKLEFILEEKAVEKGLKVLYKREKLSSLAIAINNSKEEYSKAGHAFAGEFIGQISQILREQGCIIETQDLEIISNSILSKLVKHGKVLSQY